MKTNLNHKRGTWKDAGGTSLKGYITASYDELVELFGEPDPGCGTKVEAEWVVRFDDGLVATVYNWKNGPAYGGVEVERITDWNVGGHSEAAPERIERLLEVSR